MWSQCCPLFTSLFNTPFRTGVFAVFLFFFCWKRNNFLFLKTRLLFPRYRPLKKLPRDDESDQAAARGWLLILDNVDTLAMVRDYFPIGNTGHILLTTRAQSMDALSSMGTICGYKSVLIAADNHPRIFPMLTTAAGTITPARVFVIGAGVAGLQAIATARRLGAVASAYDLRPAAKEQVQSLGGRFIELPIEAKDAQDARGYARAQDEDFYRRQRELLGRVVKESDVVITAAVIPGKTSPILVTEEMVKGMAPGSVPTNATEIFQEGIRLPPLKLRDAKSAGGIIGELTLASTNTKTSKHAKPAIRLPKTSGWSQPRLVDSMNP